MSTALLGIIAIILIVLFRILNVKSTPKAPKLYSGDLNFQEKIVKIVTELNEL